MNTEKKTENLNLISKLSISLYEDKEIERLIIERDNSPTNTIPNSKCQ